MSGLNKRLLLKNLEEGHIYYFLPTSTIGIPDHRHIFLKKNGEGLLIFSCCTSQQKTMEKLIAINNWSQSTIVKLTPNKQNKLTTDTYINCNSLQIISSDDFFENYMQGNVTINNAEIDEFSFLAIENGIIKSDLVDEETKDLFRREVFT